MAQNYYNNSIYSTTKVPVPPPRSQAAPPTYEDSVYSGQQGPARSVHSVKTGASVYSHVTKKSSDFYHSDLSGVERRQTALQQVLNFLYNSGNGAVLGRTWDAWLRTLAYHGVLYGAVALVWAASFAFFDFAVLDEDRPVRTGQHNVLRGNPSLSYVPQPDHYTSLIRYRTSRLASVRKYVDDLVAFTQWYEDHGLMNVLTSDERTKDCAPSGMNDDPLNTVCNFDLDKGRRCNAFKNFGFVDGEPCIALKLNRVYGWVPDPITGPKINSTGVIVRCRGRTPTDRDFIGDICYHYSTNGDDGKTEDYCKRDYGVFEHYYFPYLRQMRYMSPLVFVEFKRVQRNTVVMIECEAEARNIKIDRTYRIGLVQFELLID